MAIKLLHGSPERNLTEIVPGKKGGVSHPREVFASPEEITATIFTLYPDTVDFLIDFERRRVIIPDESELDQRDLGGVIYEVVGNFRPAADMLIREFSAPRARVISQKEIPSIRQHLRKMGVDIYADPGLFEAVENYVAANRRFPSQIPRNHKPINR